MNSKTLLIVSIVAAALCISGCASTLTLLSPMKSEVVISDKRAGSFQKYNYRYACHSNRIALERTPLCNEVGKSVRVEKKRQIGYGPALLEMPFFGLGLVDLATANGISESSKKVYPLGDVETGRLLTCGAAEPAAGEVLIIENPSQNIQLRAMTDKNGMIDLKEVLGDRENAVELTVRLQSNHALNFTVTYNAPMYSLGQGTTVSEN